MVFKLLNLILEGIKGYEGISGFEGFSCYFI